MVNDHVVLIRQLPTRIKKRLVQILHHQVDCPARGPAHEAAIAVPAHRERQRGMMIVVERTQALVPHHPESKSLCDPLNRQVAELLKFILFHIKIF